MKYIFGNWKMYLDLSESKVLAEAMVGERFDAEKVTVAIFPSALALSGVVEEVKDSKIAVGAQDVYWISKGAYTGAVSALMYKTAGCKYALVGHSERRHLFGETDEDVRKKIEACLDAGLTPVLCVGETQLDLDANKREYRLKKQLMKACEGLKLNGSELIFAYEPVWAISKAGVGKPCSPEEADSIQGWIKLELKNYFSKDIPVIYGGSVDAKNVVSYLSCRNVDGALVGNASTKQDSFTAIINHVIV